jgi:hypothetical protein
MKALIEVAPKRLIKLLFLIVTIGFIATGCATYQQQNRTVSTDWQHGNATNAIVEASKKADEKANGKDAIIWRLEQGAMLRANGQFEDSNKAFDMAQEKIDQYAEAAKVSIGRETAALLSNQANLPYEGRAYDGIMLNTYEALNYLALGQPDKARPELIRAYQRQQDAVEDNKKRIEKIQDEAAQNQNKATIDRAQQDRKFQVGIQNVGANLNDLKAYADYVNPFTVYLDGLFFMADAADASDLARAHKSFERVGGFVGDSDFVKADLAAVDDLMNGKPLAPTTYVIFETGSAPVRDKIRIDIPTFWPELPYLGAAFPKLKFQNNYVSSLTVTADGTNVMNTAMLASMDSVIGLDLKNEMPTIVTKTLISTTVKAVATHFAWEATRHKRQDGTLDNGGIAGALVLISATSWSAANNIADERTWTTLPKEFQFCRFPTPLDRKIDLASADGLQKTSVTIADGTVNIIYVKSINATAPLLVSQIKLK